MVQNAAVATSTAEPRPTTAGASCSVEDFTNADASAWDGYVTAHPQATFFHQAAWAEVIRQAFGHRPHYLIAREAGAVRGVLPLVHIHSRLFGSSLISVPFCVRGGVLADSEDVERALTEAAIRRATELGVGQLEIRGPAATDAGTWRGSELYFNFSKAISGDDDQNMKAIPRKQRAMVRKGIQAGLESKVSDDLDAFFHIYSTSVRNLGTPVFAKRYFRILKDTFGEACDVTTVYHEGEALASVMSFYFRDTVLPYYGGGLPAARAVKAYDFMYWELMRRSAAAGYRVFDYGRSKKGTGAFSFKKNWGFEPEPLDYRTRLIKASEFAEKNPTNPKYARFIALWQRLPLPVANTIGPYLARDLG